MFNRQPKSPVENPSALRRLAAAGTVAAVAFTLAACDTSDAKGPDNTSAPLSTGEQAPTTTTSNILTTPVIETSGEAPATSSETVSSTSETEPVTLEEKYTISAEYSDPAKFGPKFCEVLNDWLLEGYTPALLDDHDLVTNNTRSLDQKATDIVGDSDKRIIDSLFSTPIVPGSTTANFIDNTQSIHQNTVKNTLRTGINVKMGFTPGAEIYERVNTCDDKTTLANNVYTININESNNADKVKIGDTPALDADSTFTVTTNLDATGNIKILTVAIDEHFQTE